MPSTDAATAEYPTEVAVGIAILSITAGVLAEDIVVGLAVLLLTVIAYLCYRILRTLELIAAKLRSDD